MRPKYWKRNLRPISLQRVKKYNSEERERNGKKRWEEEWEEDLEEGYDKKREEQEEKKNKMRL